MNAHVQPVKTHNLQRGQATIEFVLSIAIISTILMITIALGGPQINQIFGDVQCSVKYGENAYMDTLYGESYCFRAIYRRDGTEIRDRRWPLGKPIISQARPQPTELPPA